MASAPQPLLEGMVRYLMGKLCYQRSKCWIDLPLAIRECPPYSTLKGDILFSV